MDNMAHGCVCFISVAIAGRNSNVADFHFQYAPNRSSPMSFFRFCRSEDENLLYISPRICYNKLSMHILQNFTLQRFYFEKAFDFSEGL